MGIIRITENRFNQFSFENMGNNEDWKANTELNINLSLLLGYDFKYHGWRRIPVDGERGLLTSNQGVKSDTVVQSVANITNVSSPILPENSNRVKVYLKNVSITFLYIRLGVTASTSNSYMLSENEELILENYQGILTGITAAGSASLSYIELSRDNTP